MASHKTKQWHKIATLALLFLLYCGHTATAQDVLNAPATTSENNHNTSFTVDANEWCPFSARFDTLPDVTYICPERGFCLESVDYNKALTDSHIIHFDMTCGTRSPVPFDTADKDSMVNFMLQTVDAELVQSPQISYTTLDNIKRLSMTGSRPMRELDSVLMSGLWIGESGFIRFNAYVTGANNDEADTIFTDILKSIRPVTTQE